MSKVFFCFFFLSGEGDGGGWVDGWGVSCSVLY